MKVELGAPRSRLLVGVGSAVAVVCAAVVLVVWSQSGGSAGRRIPPTRARVYSQHQACLLTPARGLADAAAAPVWAGMQDASAKTKVQVSYLAVAGEQSAANAGPYLATLAGEHCDVVLAVGAAPTGAVALEGSRFPHTRFLVIGTGVAKSNVSVVAGGSAAETRAAVESAVESVVVKASRS